LAEQVARAGWQINGNKQSVDLSQFKQIHLDNGNALSNIKYNGLTTKSAATQHSTFHQIDMTKDEFTEFVGKKLFEKLK
jgi:hypothetical protein